MSIGVSRSISHCGLAHMATVDSTAVSWDRGLVSELNATAAALLGLLHEGPQTGGQLVSAARERFGSFFSVTRSQVYRELPALADAGLVRLGKQGPRSSQQYVITAAGKKAFKTWLGGEPGPDHLRSPLILRLVHASTLTAKQRVGLIDSAKQVYNGEHEAAKTAVKTAEDPYAKAIAEFGVARAKAVLKLLDSIPKS
ncbi:DNA-binding transcriptional regulator, PadR family [Actinokineospora globicatena]|uniref:PadR family transcriptional regulator n=1 Tax=Actinokineospora globicatena TaxID=103729 RepID=A0A9W6VA65_9PSEU|nr:DNA-binding transcriptional regulator, PadR family [Actinokineospora globicatena]GLW94007.1 PadR family transcriptional regulator [Actinokineospora globicatena]